MPDETREALERALMDLLTGYTAVANRAVFLDALDARVRALATCSWTAKLVTGDVVRCVRAAGHVGDHDAGGHLRPWSSGRDEAREQAENRPSAEAVRQAEEMRALYSIAIDLAYALRLAEATGYKQQRIEALERWEAYVATLDTIDPQPSAAPRARTGGQETSGDAGRDGSLPSSHKPSGEALASVDTSRRAEGLESAAPSSPPSPEREGQDPFVHWDREQRELAAAERIAEERRDRAKRAEADVERLQRELAEAREDARVTAGDAQRNIARANGLTARVAELEGALRKVSHHCDVAGSCGEVGCTTVATCDLRRIIDAALTPSAAKPEPPEPAAKGDGAKCSNCGDARVSEADAELAKIVAWLRDGGRGATVDNVHCLADALERHAHRKETR